jgi:hypothetical protein
MGSDNRIEILLEKEILEIQISFEQIGVVDIDFVAFMVDSKNKIPRDDCFIFYNSINKHNFNDEKYLRPISNDLSFYGEPQEDFFFEEHDFDSNMFFNSELVEPSINLIIIYGTVFQNSDFNRSPLMINKGGVFNVSILNYQSKHRIIDLEYIIKDSVITIELGWFEKKNGVWIFVKSGKCTNMDLFNLVSKYTE